LNYGIHTSTGIEIYDIQKEEVSDDQSAWSDLSPAALIAIVLGGIALLSLMVAIGVFVWVKTRPGTRDGGQRQKE
jgi:hypothetical protein